MSSCRYARAALSPRCMRAPGARGSRTRRPARYMVIGLYMGDERCKLFNRREGEKTFWLRKAIVKVE